MKLSRRSFHMVISSGFYSYKKNKNLPTQTQIRNEHLQKEIKKIHKESYGIYGSPKITVLLNKNGENVSQKHVYNLMHSMGIKARYVRHYTKSTISEDYSTKIYNLLSRHFNSTKTNTVWCTHPICGYIVPISMKCRLYCMITILQDQETVQKNS